MLGEVDRMFFKATGDTHRLRPASAEEAAGFTRIVPGYPSRKTVVRAADGASVTYAFKEDGELSDACDFELAGWFDDDLDAEVARGRA